LVDLVPQADTLVLGLLERAEQLDDHLLEEGWFIRQGWSSRWGRGNRGVHDNVRAHVH